MKTTHPHDLSPERRAELFNAAALRVAKARLRHAAPGTPVHAEATTTVRRLEGDQG